MMNACVPMNNKTYANMIDAAIIYENGVYRVFGLTEEFQGVILGEYDNVLDAYVTKLEYGFDGCFYEVAISPYENKVVEFTLD